MELSQRHFKVFAWTIYQPWRQLLGSIFFFTMLTLWKDLLPVSWLEGVYRSIPILLGWVLRYNSHLCYVANIHALFNAFRCPTSDFYFIRPGNLERHLTTCQVRVKQGYPKTVYQLKETLFDKLDSFNLLTSSNCLRLLQYLISSQFVYEKMASKTQRQHDRLENMFRYLYQSLPTYYKSPFLFATPTRVI